MLKVKTPATTSNLGVGFDCLGMAVNRYNIFAFNRTLDFEVFGFDEEYRNDNLVLKVYLDFCEKYQVKDVCKVSITLSQNDIPIARGLGSSASCVVAGALAANHFNELHLDLAEIAAYCAEYEGHPDNVFACIYGGLVSVFKEEEKFFYEKLDVSEDLNFGLMIPNVVSKTEELRDVLPKQISLSDAVYNLSRIVQLPKAFASGDLLKLSKVVKDKYHEVYRAKFIPSFEELKKKAGKNNIVPLISGSGSAVFLIGKQNNFSSLKEFSNTFKLEKVRISEGTESGVI